MYAIRSYYVKLEVLRVFTAESPFNEEEFLKGRVDDLSEKLFNTMWDAYSRKSQMIAKQAFPVIKEVYETKAEMYNNIVVPISDGHRIFNITTNLKKAYETEGAELVRAYEKTSILVTIDEAWKEHLRELDDLRQAVQNATYEQKDPLLIYKFESFNLFKSMIGENNKVVVSTLAKGHIPIQNADSIKEAELRKKSQDSRIEAHKDEFHRPGAQQGARPQEPVRQERVQPVRVV